MGEVWNSEGVHFLGLDIGTTTTHALLASAELLQNCLTGRKQFSRPNIVYRSPLVFTPFSKHGIDEQKLSALMDEWTSEACLKKSELVGGGAILTGLAAESSNAPRLKQFILDRFGEDFVVTVADPHLESWVSFMGSVESLSRSFPEATFLHFDIGGGTTNVAVGRNGTVIRTGSYFIGARHFEFIPGTYELLRMSPYGEELAGRLGIRAKVGALLPEDSVQAIVKSYVEKLEQTEFRTPARPDVITFSGGVGELIYGETPDGKTPFGDLGTDLAEAIRQSPLLSLSISSHVPDFLGRATVMGMAVYTADISGSTCFIASPELLPLRDVPIIGALSDTDVTFKDLIARAMVSSQPTAIRLRAARWNLETVQRMGKNLAEAFECVSITGKPAPIILLVDSNVGKTLGELATRWRKLPVPLIVVDEIPDRGAQFVRLGKINEGIVPITFYGIEGK